jgi:glutamate dehydrogenase/leucine dehydrogenase
MPTTSSWSNPVNGANIAGFQKVANAMLDQGLV